ncbi:trafficking protein particle complex subunit 2-like protein isoform X2 [Ammospiza nelsoni]|nr:trafficking protein particle complex subunit 2-like protein isoform X2 [Ammospiza nelsoni]
MGKALVDQRELYLGLLYPTEDYKVYGYVTNSKVKFVMVVDSSNTALRDNEIRSMFRKLHNSYTDIMCNPFYNPGDRIHSRSASQGSRSTPQQGRQRAQLAPLTPQHSSAPAEGQGTLPALSAPTWNTNPTDNLPCFEGTGNTTQPTASRGLLGS